LQSLRLSRDKNSIFILDKIIKHHTFTAIKILKGGCKWQRKNKRKLKKQKQLRKRSNPALLWGYNIFANGFLIEKLSLELNG